MTSNWQRVNEAIVRGILEAPVDLLNISVDGDDAESYESSRLGGSFPRLLNNLAHLREMRRAFPRRTLVNLRVMLRPSQARRLQEIRRFWSEYADEVSLQFVVDDAGTGGDVYGVHTVRDRYPRCSLTFKQLNVHWNGDVPLCTYATRQADQSEDAYLGNIHDQTLEELWQHALIVQYRKAHRERLCGQMPLCNGCGGF